MSKQEANGVSKHDSNDGDAVHRDRGIDLEACILDRHPLYRASVLSS